MELKHRRTISMWVIHKLPETVLMAPERVFLKFACVLVGIGVLLADRRPGSIVSQMPNLLVYEIGLMFIIGGAGALYGIIKPNRAFERLGLLATTLASFSYSLSLYIIAGNAVITAVTIFTGLGLASLTRLAVSSASGRIFDSLDMYMSHPEFEDEPGDRS